MGDEGISTLPAVASLCVCCQVSYSSSTIQKDLEPLSELLNGLCIACLRDVVQEAQISARTDAHLSQVVLKYPPENWLSYRERLLQSASVASLRPAAADLSTVESNRDAWHHLVLDMERTKDAEAIEAANMNEQQALWIKKRAIVCASRELKQLATYHLLNTTFFIWVADDCGTINGCRLGRSSTISVTGRADADSFRFQIPIVEVNTALGDVAFLLHCLTKETDMLMKEATGRAFVSEVGRVQVKGKQSVFVSLLDEGALFPLYMSESRLSSYFHLPKMNEGLGGLTLLFKEMLGALERIGERGVKEPFEVQGHTVSGHSVKYRAGEEASWTAAWRLFLIDLKWLVGYLSQLKLVKG